MISDITPGFFGPWGVRLQPRAGFGVGPSRSRAGTGAGAHAYLYASSSGSAGSIGSLCSHGTQWRPLRLKFKDLAGFATAQLGPSTGNFRLAYRVADWICLCTKIGSAVSALVCRQQNCGVRRNTSVRILSGLTGQQCRHRACLCYGCYGFCGFWCLAV